MFEDGTISKVLQYEIAVSKQNLNLVRISASY